jgi:hypothetical protein
MPYALFRFSDTRMRAGEKQVSYLDPRANYLSKTHPMKLYNKIRQDEAIRYPMSKVETAPDKVFVLIQVSLEENSRK